MSSINTCLFSGNATRDPEIKVSSTGSIYAQFGIALNSRVFDSATGEYCDSVAYIDFIAFGENATYVRDHVRRGVKVYVEAKVEQSMYRDKKDGKIKRWTSYRVTSIDANESRASGKWTSPEWI